MTTRVEHDTDSSALAATEIHDVLRNHRRRLVLERLAAECERQTMSGLAEHIAAVESGEDPPPRNVRQSVYVSLHQTHLPKLDDLGIVSYDADEKWVCLADRAAEVTIYMEVVPKYGLSWGEYYFGLGLLGFLLLVGWAVGVPVLASTEPFVLAVGTLAVLVVSAVYHIGTQGSTLLDRIGR
jgi:hypothetical protein